MRIYLYQEYCVSKGKVFYSAAMTDAEKDDFVDVFLFGDGSEEELIRQARAELLTVSDHRPGGAGDAFRRRCAQRVLAYLGASEVTD